VDQKVAYISGKPPSVTVEGAEKNAGLKAFESLITGVTSDEEFADTLSDLETGASNKGVEWLHVYYDKSGSLKYVIVPAQGCIPLYDTQYQKELIEMIRYYEISVVKPGSEMIRKHVEWWTARDVSHYHEDEDGEYILEYRLPHWFGVTSIDEREVKREAHGWGKVPFIPLYNNSRAQSDLMRNKGLIDAYNLISSSSTNNQVDLVELYWLIQGYGGETAKAIQQKLKINKAVNISDPNGKIQAEQVTLGVADRLEWLKMLRRDIYHLGMAIDTDDESFGSAPSGVALKFRYTQLDMKADKMILKLKKAMKDFFWFVTEDINRKNGTSYDAGLIRFDINKSMITNDLETVQIITQSQGLVPDKLLLAKHPYVDDVNQVMEDMEAQKKKNVGGG
ncbi:MAG: phage portal protein, partial [Bacillota bacterium]|nr:phage portal protein [Bacillota bacterium]